MKTVGKLVFGLAFLLAGSCVFAQSPRDQLSQLVEQLQRVPADNALRERIVKLGAEIKPAPAIPEEANRLFVRGNVFQKEAKDASGYDPAIASYRQALNIAPWWGDAYFNLAAALESTNKFAEATAAVKLFMATVPPGSAEAREAQNRIYAIEAKSEIATKQAVAAQASVVAAEAQRRRRRMEGTWSSHGFVEVQVIASGDRFSLGPVKLMGQFGLAIATEVVIDSHRLRFVLEQPACPSCRSVYDVVISEDGRELRGMISKAGSTENTKFDKLP